jgi:hypothetical protein
MYFQSRLCKTKRYTHEFTEPMLETFRSKSTETPPPGKKTVWLKSLYNKDCHKMKKILRPSLVFHVTQRMLLVIYRHCVASHRSEGLNCTMLEAWNLANKILFLSCIQYICKFFTFAILRWFIPVVLSVTYIFHGIRSYTTEVNSLKFTVYSETHISLLH